MELLLVYDNLRHYTPRKSEYKNVLLLELHCTQVHLRMLKYIFEAL